MKKSDMLQRVNTVEVSLGKSNDMIISKVFNSQCTHFYGAQAWWFGDKVVKEFKTMWNRCMRRLLPLPYETQDIPSPSLGNTKCQWSDIQKISKDATENGKPVKTTVPVLLQGCVGTQQEASVEVTLELLPKDWV